MQNLDTTILATAIPTIAADMGIASTALSNTVTAYMLAYAIGIPASGWIADKFGARNTFATAIVIFMLASIAAALSNSADEMVAARIGQGVAAAMMSPIGRLIILRTTDPARLIPAMAQMTMPALIGPALGPLIGGLVVTYTSWRWIFLVNIPIGIVGVILVLIYVPRLQQTVPRFDLLGFLLTTVALGSFLIALNSFGAGARSPILTAAILAFAVVAILFYFLRARRITNPALNPAVFKFATYRAAVLSGSLFRIGAGATPFLLPLLFQLSLGFTPLMSGALTFVTAIGAMCMKPLATPLFRRFGFRAALLLNGLGAGAILMCYSALQWIPAPLFIIVVLFIGGLLRSLQFAGLNTLAFAEIPRDLISSANTTSSVAQQMSFGTGVAVSAAIIGLTPALLAIETAFVTAFFAAGLLIWTSSLLIARLPQDAGAQISGNRPFL